MLARKIWSVLGNQLSLKEVEGITDFGSIYDRTYDTTNEPCVRENARKPAVVSVQNKHPPTHKTPAPNTYLDDTLLDEAHHDEPHRVGLAAVVVLLVVRVELERRRSVRDAGSEAREQAPHHPAHRTEWHCSHPNKQQAIRTNFCK